MASRYKAKHWLHGLTAEPFLKFVDFILGERVHGLQIPGVTPDQSVKMKPDWSIVLAFEQKLRREAMKLVTQEGHTLADAMRAVIRDADLKEAFFTTPVALKAAQSMEQPYKWHKTFDKGGKGKGKKGKKGEKGKREIPDQLKGLNLAWRTPDGRDLCFAWNTGDCAGKCGRVHQCRVKGCYGDHKAVDHKLKVMYLFAGKRRQSDVGSLLRAGEEAGHFNLVLKEIDLERGPENDLRDKQLWESIFAELQQGDWFLIVSPPCNSFSRARFQYRKHPGPRPLRNRTWPKGFPWLSRHNKQIVDEANSFIEQCLAACRISAAAGGKFLLEHPEDLGLVEGEHPGSIWQWEELQELLVSASALTFAIHQCQFGALFPKPTRLLTNARVEDSRCHFGLPRFDKCSQYIGPLSRSCGHHHEHKLIGKTQEKWNTAPSAAYPEGLCRFIMQVILDSCSHSPGGGGVKNLKRKVGGSQESQEKS